MPLIWYAETPVRRIRQVATDLVAVLALLCCYWLGATVHDLTAELASPGRSLESGGAALADRMTDAGSAADDVPLVGDELAVPFEQASEAGRSIQDAGVKQQEVVHTLALTLGWVIGGIPALGVLLLWLPRRLRFARRASNARRLVRSGVGLDVFALRALASQPLSELAKLRADPAEGWRQSDPEMIAALAALELRRFGLRGRGVGQRAHS